MLKIKNKILIGFASFFYLKSYDNSQEPRNFYAEFGITRHCSTKEIRQAYKQASLKHFPDKIAPGASSDNFLRVKYLYDVRLFV